MSPIPNTQSPTPNGQRAAGSGDWCVPPGLARAATTPKRLPPLTVQE
ncbi:MAG: hypothetical protein PVF45_14960 [Anaerolineae bacterium]